MNKSSALYGRPPYPLGQVYGRSEAPPPLLLDFLPLPWGGIVVAGRFCRVSGEIRAEELFVKSYGDFVSYAMTAARCCALESGT